MKEQEKQLLKALCKFEECTIDGKLTEFATPAVLGHLFFNRMQGVSYDVLRKNKFLGKVNREFRNSLAASYEQNLQKNRSFFSCVEMLSKILSQCDCNVAMLKGAYLCMHYPEGYRTSNDIDLLVLPQDVSTVGKRLSSAGFEQGHIRNGEFIPATRREIIESKMMRGETIPYIKEVKLPYMKYLEVDINFSLDYKPGDSKILSAILSRSYLKFEKGTYIPTLEMSDFFIHLCAHLYKEATTLPWVEMKRDMTLYKYCDIYLLLQEMSKSEIRNMFLRAKELGMEQVCAYSILETMELFDMELNSVKALAEHFLKEVPEFRFTVTSPKDGKKYRYKTESAWERFFMENRILDLKEVSGNGKTQYAKK